MEPEPASESPRHNCSVQAAANRICVAQAGHSWAQFADGAGTCAAVAHPWWLSPRCGMDRECELLSLQVPGLQLAAESLSFIIAFLCPSGTLVGRPRSFQAADRAVPRFATVVATILAPFRCASGDCRWCVGVLGFAIYQRTLEPAFSFTLTGRIVASSMAFALLMGFLGGFLPATRAARLNIVDALRPHDVALSDDSGSYRSCALCFQSAWANAVTTGRLRVREFYARSYRRGTRNARPPGRSSSA